MLAQIPTDTIDDLERLVDELVKNHPDEQAVQRLMQKIDLTYSSEPVERISAVLEKMNELVFHRPKKKESYDLR